MTDALVVALAVMTYLSRAVPLVFLPRPSPRLASVLSRIPAPLFAAFASISLVGRPGETASVETLGAVAAALIATRTRSLLVILATGLGGYLVTLGLVQLLPS